MLDHLAAGTPVVSDLLAHVDRDVLAGLMAHCGARARLGLSGASSGHPLGAAPTNYPVIRAAGMRRSRRVGPSVRWHQLTETVEIEGCPQPLRVDLLELDLSRVRMEACGASCAAPGMAFADVGASVGQVRRGSPSPGDEFFRRLGVVRLAEAVAARGAVAGINGGFYLDYGHYLDALDLGLDLVSQPGLRLGEVVGWFVSGGHQYSPAVFNRAALVVTADRRAHMCRVRPSRVVLANERELTWLPRPGQPDKGVLFLDHVLGATTARTPERVDVVIDGTTVVAIRPGGESPVPLLGFVLSVPGAHAASLLGNLAVGDPVTIGNDFPPGLGPVEEAMACGPLLVRDGQVDLDFGVEGFGEKDSTVLPMSLTRAVGSFRAARSFAMLRSGRLVLGVVSGALLGGGPPTISVGTNFGELAQLCIDLGADQAMAFDGGGSSSLVARIDDQPRILNIPTGGADVASGAERFVKTYWLALDGNR